MSTQLRREDRQRFGLAPGDPWRLSCYRGDGLFDFSMARDALEFAPEPGTVPLIQPRCLVVRRRITALSRFHWVFTKDSGFEQIASFLFYELQNVGQFRYKVEWVGVRRRISQSELPLGNTLKVHQVTSSVSEFASIRVLESWWSK